MWAFCPQVVFKQFSYFCETIFGYIVVYFFFVQEINQFGTRCRTKHIQFLPNLKWPIIYNCNWIDVRIPLPIWECVEIHFSPQVALTTNRVPSCFFPTADYSLVHTEQSRRKTFHMWLWLQSMDVWLTSRGRSIAMHTEPYPTEVYCSLSDTIGNLILSHAATSHSWHWHSLYFIWSHEAHPCTKVWCPSCSPLPTLLHSLLSMN